MRLLLRRAVDDDALRADAVVGADERAEGGRGPPKPEGDLRLLRHGQPEAAILLRDRQAEEAERAHLGDDLGRDAVLLGDALLERPQALGHEALDGVEELGERVAVERHRREPFRARRAEPCLVPRPLQDNAADRAASPAHGR